MCIKARYGLVVALIVAPLNLAHAGPPFVTDDPEPTDYGHFEIYLFSLGAPETATKTQSQFGLEANYGALPDVQVSASLPVGFSAPDRAGVHVEVSDAEFGVKYRFIEEDADGWRPQVSFYPSTQFALGKSNANIDDGAMQEFLPLWAQKSFGDWTTFGGGGYRIDPNRGARNSWFAGWALLRQVTDRLQLGCELYRQTPESIGGKGTTGFGAGALFDLNESFHLVGSAGPSVSAGGTAKALTYYIAFEWTT